MLLKHTGLITNIAFFYLCFLINGIYLEKLTNSFKASICIYMYSILILNTASSFITMISSYSISIIFRPLSTKNKLFPICRYYGIAATTHSLSVYSSIVSLGFVSYPCQVLLKTLKPFMILLLQIIIIRKKHKFATIISIVLVVSGALMFSYGEIGNISMSDISIKPRVFINNIETTYYFYYLGIFLIVFSLSMDGMTGSFQEKIFLKYFHFNDAHMLFYTSLFQLIIGFIGIIAFGLFFPDQLNNSIYKSNQNFLSPFIIIYTQLLYVLSFFNDSKSVIIYLFSYCMGQLSIYYSMSKIGPLLLSTITTVRKITAVLLSVLIFEHQITSLQIYGTISTFIGVFLQIRSANINK